MVKVAADGVVFDGFVVANEVCATGGVYQDLIGIDQYLTAPTGVQILNCVLGPNTNTASQDGTKGRSGVTVYGPHALPVKLVVMHNKIFDSKGNGCGIMIVGPYGPTYHGGVVHVNHFAGSVIEDNDILGNHRTGIELAGGVQGGTAWADHVLIRNNLIADNGWFALARQGQPEVRARHHVHPLRRRQGQRRRRRLAVRPPRGQRHPRQREERPVRRAQEQRPVRDRERHPGQRQGHGRLQPLGRRARGPGRALLRRPALPDYGFLANVSFATGGILGNGALGVHVMQTPTARAGRAPPATGGATCWGRTCRRRTRARATAITGCATYAPWWTTASGPCDGYGAEPRGPGDRGAVHLDRRTRA